jgi:hypothetical protein
MDYWPFGLDILGTAVMDKRDLVDGYMLALTA